MDLDLGTLQTLLGALESQAPQAQEPLPQAYQSPGQLHQPYATSFSQPQATSCIYSQQTVPYQYHTSTSYLPSSTSATHSSFHSSLPSVPPNHSPVTPIFSPSLSAPATSQTKIIYDLLGTLEPVRRPSQYFLHSNFPPTPNLVSSQISESLPLTASTSRPREDDDDGHSPNPSSKKPKLSSPSPTPTFAGEGTLDLSVAIRAGNMDHAQGRSSRLPSLDSIPPGSITANDRVTIEITDSAPSPGTSRNASLASPIEFAYSLSPVTQDLTQMKFAQALPILTRLVETDSFLDSVQEIKDKQEDFELRLKDERNRLETDGKRAVKQAQSSGRSESDIQRLQQTLDSDLANFDRAALSRWDGLKSQQQLAFQNLGVPTFCLTTDPAVLKRQRQVLEIILGALNDRETTTTTATVQDEEPS